MSPREPHPPSAGVAGIRCCHDKLLKQQLALSLASFEHGRAGFWIVSQSLISGAPTSQCTLRKSNKGAIACLECNHFVGFDLEFYEIIHV